MLIFIGGWRQDDSIKTLRAHPEFEPESQGERQALSQGVSV